MLGIDFLDTHFAVLGIGDHIMTLHCTDYMITTSLTCDPAHDWCFERIVVLAATEILYKQYRKEIWKNTLMYIAIVHYRSKFPLPSPMQTMLLAPLQSLAI